MDRRVFEKAVNFNEKIRCIEGLLDDFETQARTGRDVTVVFTNDSSMKPVVDEFREVLRCLLSAYNREIEEL